MKVWKILKKVGSGILKTVVPGAAQIIDIVNELLPGDQRLPADATGEQVERAIETLPPEQRAQVLDRELEVKLEDIRQSNDTLRTMLEAESKSQHSTRPKIALRMSNVVAFAIIAIVTAFAVAIVKGDAAMLKEVKQSGFFVLAVLAPIVGWLNAYFGILRKESAERIAAAGGQPPVASGLAGLISTLVRRR